MFAFPLLFPPNTTHLNALRPAQVLCGPADADDDGGDLRRIRSKKDLDADGGGEGGIVCSSLACWMFAAAVKISLTPRPRGALDSKYVAWIERANAEACHVCVREWNRSNIASDMPHRTTLLSVASRGMFRQG